MPDWTRSMQQTYGFYKVDPESWLDIEKLDTVKDCTIDYDSETATLGSGSFTLGEAIEECYLRVYLETYQDGRHEKEPLGTLLVMSPSSSFNGKSWSIKADGYTPLIELKEKYPPLGYTVMEEQNALEMAYTLIRENARAPIAQTTDSTAKIYEEYVANTEDTWLAYITDLLETVKYKFDIDAMGRILMAPQQDPTSLQPRATFNDDNSSILYAEIETEDDLYGIPNVVEIIYSNSDGYTTSRVVNDDPDSLTSTVRRGREIQYRETSPNISGNPSQEELDEYAETLLRNLSTLQKTITFTHGYQPVRVGDCVTLNYKAANIQNVKANIIRQSITCNGKACKIQETAIYTKKLWK